MTPQERQLINDLFQRLASLENNPRDPDAEAMIREGLRRAPNGVYSLVQSVLVQDEALKAANNRIQEYEQQSGGPQQHEEQPRGFLDSVRGSIFGRDEQRGSVPRVPQGGAPAGRADPWGRSRVIRNSKVIRSSKGIRRGTRPARRCSRRAVVAARSSAPPLRLRPA